MSAIAVTTETSSLNSQAQQLAMHLNLPFVEFTSIQFPYLLVLDENKLALHFPQNKLFKPFFVDFSHGEIGYRAQHAAGRNELIAKAIGIKKDYRPAVIDATAGFARDGFLLACLGCQLILLEKSAVIYQLVKDGLRRYELEYPDLANTLVLNLLNMDAVTYLQQLDNTHSAEVIYLDPMFPQRDKTAKVKKEMQILQLIIGEPTDTNKLFTAALQKAKKRVVVKRPIHAPCLTELKPDLIYRGKNTRFDVYLTNQPLSR